MNMPCPCHFLIFPPPPRFSSSIHSSKTSLPQPSKPEARRREQATAEGDRMANHCIDAQCDVHVLWQGLQVRLHQQVLWQGLQVRLHQEVASLTHHGLPLPCRPSPTLAPPSSRTVLPMLVGGFIQSAVRHPLAKCFNLSHFCCC